MSGSVIFNGDLLLSMIYGVRTSATALTQFTILTTDAPITGTIGNLVAGRVTTADGFGSFAVSMADAGSDLVLSDFTATPLTYALWKTAFAFAPGGELFTADNDRDGLNNGLEYGLGSDPLVADADAAPRVSLTEAVAGSGVRFLTLTYERPAGVNRPTDLAWNVQRNTDPTNAAGWSGTGLAAEQVTPQPGTGLEKVVVRSQTPINTVGISREFLRLSVQKL